MGYKVVITYPEHNASVGEGPATRTKIFGTKEEAEMWLSKRTLQSGSAVTVKAVK